MISLSETQEDYSGSDYKRSHEEVAIEDDEMRRIFSAVLARAIQDADADTLKIKRVLKGRRKPVAKDYPDLQYVLTDRGDLREVCFNADIDTGFFLKKMAEKYAEFSQYVTPTQPDPTGIDQTS